MHQPIASGQYPGEVAVGICVHQRALTTVGIGAVSASLVDFHAHAIKRQVAVGIKAAGAVLVAEEHVALENSAVGAQYCHIFASAGQGIKT